MRAEETPALEELGGMGAGIKRRQGGWWVQIGWSCFKVSAAPRRGGKLSFEQAQTAHAALCEARAVRRSAARSTATTCPPGTLGTRTKRGLDRNVLTDREFRNILCEDPTVMHYFSTDSSGSDLRLQSAWTPSLDSALRFRQLLLTDKTEANKEQLRGLMSSCPGDAAQEKDAQQSQTVCMEETVRRVLSDRRQEAERQEEAAAPRA